MKNEEKSASARIRTGVRTLHEWYYFLPLTIKVESQEFE